MLVDACTAGAKDSKIVSRRAGKAGKEKNQPENMYPVVVVVFVWSAVQTGEEINIISQESRKPRPGAGTPRVLMFSPYWPQHKTQIGVEHHGQTEKVLASAEKNLFSWFTEISPPCDKERGVSYTGYRHPPVGPIQRSHSL